MFTASLPDTAAPSLPAAPDLGAELTLRALLAAARSLADAAASGQSEQGILQIGIELAVDLVAARYGAIGIIDDKDDYRHFVYTGLSPEQAERIGAAPKGHGVLRQIMAQREGFRINNLSTVARGASYPPHHPRMDTLLAVPIVNRGRPQGRMYLCDRRDGKPFSALDELLVSHLAQYLMLTLDQLAARTAPAHATAQGDAGMEHFRLLLDLSPGALLVVQGGMIMAANAQAMPILGAQTLGQLIGRPFAALIHPDSQLLLMQRLAESASTARLPCAELRVGRLDGSEGWIEEESARIHHLGRAAALVSIKDITADFRARQQLAALHTLAEQLNRADTTEAVYRAGLDALRATSGADRSAILLFDKSACMRFVAWEGLSKDYRRATDGHSPWSEDATDPQPIFVSDPRQCHELDTLLPALEAEGIASLAFIPIVHRRKLIGKFMLYFNTARTFPTELTRHMLSIAEHVGIGLSRQQATDRSRRLNHQLEARMRKRTRQLEEANRDLEAFSYSVSHDLRGPLRAMNGFATILLTEHGDRIDDTGRGYLGRVVNASRRMERLIDDLLRLSRVNRLIIQPEAVDLTALAQEIATKLTESDPRRKVSWEIEPAMSVEADPGLLRIMLENLIENAWKYSSRKTAALIRIGRGQHNGHAGFEIADNGAGFDMQYADKLFSPFQRLHTPSEFAGTGIGLAIVQRILRRHGGSISAQAVIDAGASFTFSFWDDGQHEELANGNGANTEIL